MSAEPADMPLRASRARSWNLAHHRRDNLRHFGEPDNRHGTAKCAWLNSHDRLARAG